MNLTPGSYKCRAVSPAVMHKSSQQGTPGATVTLRIEDGPNKGALIDWTGWLTEKAKPRTIESLVLMGFDGENPGSVTKNEVIAVIENESREYKNEAGETKTITESRVQWINDPNRQGGAKFLPLSDAERVIIAGDIKAAVAMIKKSAPESPPKATPKF